MTRMARKALGQVNRSPKHRGKVEPQEPVEAPKAGESASSGSRIVTMRDGTKYRRTEHGNLVKVQN